MDATELESCQNLIGHRFKDPALLTTALTHASLTPGEMSYERLEFLGDAVLGMVIARAIYEEHPSLGEGELTKIKSVIVSRPSLSEATQRLGLERFLQVGKGLASGKPLPASLVADLFEATVAAIYLDGGITEAERFILRTLDAAIQKGAVERDRRNFKSILQQYAQERLALTPRYEVLKTWGPDHERNFEVVALLGETRGETGQGLSKKEAEQAAAEATLRKIMPGGIA